MSASLPPIAATVAAQKLAREAADLLEAGEVQRPHAREKLELALKLLLEEATPP